MKPSFPALLAAPLLIFSAFSASAQLINYTFNEGAGTTAANSGSATGNNLTLSSPATWAAGVSGQAGDYAYSGTNSASSYGATSSAFTALNGATKMTITGWYNTSEYTHFIARASDGFGTGFTLRQSDPFAPANPGNILLNTGDSTIASTGGHYDDYSNQWVFFAVSWDGTSTIGAVNFYYGTTGQAVGLDSSVDRTGRTSIGAVATNGLYFGNSTAHPFYEAFVGQLDDFRIYNSVLTQSQLEGVRSSALVPEPGTFALAGLGLMGLGLVRRRVRK